MFRATKYHFRFFVFVLSILGCGCLFLDPILGPGYEVRLELNGDVGMTTDDLARIEEMILSEGFGSKYVVTEGNTEGINFHRRLDEKFHLRDAEHAYIQILYCYTLDGDSRVIDFHVSVMNPWLGQDCAVKAEIDRIAALLRSGLEERFGQVVQQRSLRTGPPF